MKLYHLGIAAVLFSCVPAFANDDRFGLILYGRDPDDTGGLVVFHIYGYVEITQHNQEVVWLFQGIRDAGLIPEIHVLKIEGEPVNSVADYDDRWQKQKLSLSGEDWFDNGVQNVADGESTVYSNLGTDGVRLIFLHDDAGTHPDHPSVDAADPDGDGYTGYAPFNPESPYSPGEGIPPTGSPPYVPPTIDTGFVCLNSFLDENNSHPLVTFFQYSFGGSPGISLSIPIQVPGHGTYSVQIESNLYEDSGPLTALIAIRSVVYGIGASLLTMLFIIKLIRVVRQW